MFDTWHRLHNLEDRVKELELAVKTQSLKLKSLQEIIFRYFEGEGEKEGGVARAYKNGKTKTKKSTR